MEARLQQQIRVVDLARAVNLSTSRFTSLFRAQTGVSPGQYLQTRRLEQARSLIESTFLTVKEVMASVGFNDPSHFTRAFARHHGTTPSGLRLLGAPSVSSTHDSAAAETPSRFPNGQAIGRFANIAIASSSVDADNVLPDTKMNRKRENNT